MGKAIDPRKAPKAKKKRRRPGPLVRKPGAAPGSLHVEPGAARPHVYLTRYGPELLEEREEASLDGVDAWRREARGLLWVDVAGLGDPSLLEALAERFGIHRLVLEDIVSGGQRPKTEAYEGRLFSVAYMARLVEGRLEMRQVSLFFGQGFVLSFRDELSDPFEAVRERIRASSGRLRHRGADYLAYALVDTLIDGFFPVLTTFQERVATLEEEVLDSASKETVRRVHELRADLMELRRLVWPHREVISGLSRGHAGVMEEETLVFLADAADHVEAAIDLIGMLRDAGADLMNASLSASSQRLNEVMKLLTLISTIFIPLSFLAGLYGMNFDTSSPYNMPELEWRFGYPAVLGLMLFVVVSLLVFFKRRRWI